MPAVPRPSASSEACPGCGRRPRSVETAARLRAELAVRWLVRETGGLVARRFCHGCVPSGPVSEVLCGYCGDGPLLAGALAAVDPATDPVVAGWLVAQGWRLEPALICPLCRRAFDRTRAANEPRHAKEHHLGRDDPGGSAGQAPAAAAAHTERRGAVLPAELRTRS